MKRRTVPSLGLLKCLPKPKKAGEVVYCEKEDQLYYSTMDGEWMPKGNTTELDTGITLLEYTQKALSQAEPVNDLEQLKDFINKLYEQTNNKHYMLLSNEIRYFTLYEFDEQQGELTLTEDLIEVIQSLGDIKDYGEVSGGIEIWIQYPDTEFPYPFYFFPYDEGVIYVKP